MRAGSGFQRGWFFAFPMPLFRLRHVFATSSYRLRGRLCNALGLSNLRSDSPLDSALSGLSYLDSIGALNASSALGSLAVSTVLRANGVAGQLFQTASSGQAPLHGHIADSCLECWDNQLTIKVTVHDFSQLWSSNGREEEQSVFETCSATPMKCALDFAQETMCQT